MSPEKSIIQKLSVFERKILRKIYGPTEEDNGIWRIKTNKGLDEFIKHRNIINYVKAQRLSWFGHINRMPEICIVKKIYKRKPFTSRPVGRPKYRWEDDVRSDLTFNPLNPELNPICYLLALLGAHHFIQVSRKRVKILTFRRLMSYIYGAPILDVSRSHTTTQHSR